MNPEFRKQMKETRQRLREQRATQRVALKAMIEKQKSSPAFVAALAAKKKRRRRRQVATALIIILLLLLIKNCSCDEAPVEEQVGAQTQTAFVGPPLPPPPPPPFRGKVKKSKRPKMEVKAPAPPPWLDQFRLQVAARSPRLAACLNGNERPGAMRLSGLVYAKSGRVAEAVIEPAFRGSNLKQSQLDCLVKGLTEQDYKLDDPDPQAVARRVSLIFEF